MPYLSVAGPGSRHGAGLLRMLCALGLLTVAVVATAIPIHLDTSAHQGANATLSITLLDGDFTANNQATISQLQTDGTFGLTECINGCTDLPPFTLDDTNQLGMFLQELTLGSYLSFNLTFTQAFSGVVDAVSDLVIGELLDGAGFALYDTELDALNAPVPYQDALFVADLAGNRVIGAANLTTVPEPASLALMASGLALLGARRKRTLRNLITRASR